MQLEPGLIERLILIESSIHYGVPPPSAREPFIYLDRRSPVLLSAPHGCRTCRNEENKKWHDEDEYTAGMALLLAELFNVSVIVTLWLTPDSDPNYTPEEQSPYKQRLRKLAGSGARLVIDLHGAGQASIRMAPQQLVDLGFGPNGAGLAPDGQAFVRAAFERRLGAGATQRGPARGWNASLRNRTVTAFAVDSLAINAFQVELKPAVRVPWRRADATLYGKDGPFQARPEQVLGTLQALADIIEHFNPSGGA
jgi:hypothetical protein